MNSEFPNNEIFNQDNLNEYIVRMRKGDNDLREKFIEENKNMILKVVSQVLGKSAIPKNSKEYDVAITAFNYCIDNYNLNGNENFNIYTEELIKEWMYQYIWEENSKNKAAEDPSNDYSKEYLYRNFENKDEIITFKQKLWEFGITLRDLFFLGPRDMDQIKFSLKVANNISDSKILYKSLITNKVIPFDDLDDRLKNHKKSIEKNKEYIIALTLIQNSDLKVLKSYFLNIEHGKSGENIGIILELFKKDAIVMNFSGQFLIIKIDRNSSRSIGKQVQLSKDGAHVSYNRIIRYVVMSAGAIAILIFIIAGSKILLSNNSNNSTPASKSKIVQSEATALSESDEDKVVVEPSDSPKGSASVETSIIPSNSPNKSDDGKQSILEEATQPVGSPKDMTSPTIPIRNTPQPSVKPSKQASQSKLQILQTIKPSIKTNPSPKGDVKTGAQGIPGPVSISADSYQIKQGDFVSLYIEMPGGNNGKNLIIYENNEAIGHVIELTDDTPNPQTKTIGVKPDHEGIFTYKCKLVNSFGSSSSSVITIVVN
ncbi:MAG: hypothetical protein Q8942_16420 [Bacillota bacterium]|nr:hypothetical protein [Bacillota bacterium]